MERVNSSPREAVGRLVALGQQHGAISWAKKCGLSALRVLVPGFPRGGKVCAESTLCAISRRIELEMDGTTCFLRPIHDGLPPRVGRWSKSCQSLEDALGTPCLLRNHLLSLRPRR
jgi:hypothetical protein